MSHEIPRAFFAYPSKPEIAETIRNGVTTVNQMGVVQIKTWENCKVGGKFIINEICREIDESQLFCADLTTLNHNVMFELGYAIARNKRIWLAIDPSLTASRSDFHKLQILTTVGYSEYCNSHDLSGKFLKDQPWLDLTDTVFNTAIKIHLPQSARDTALYLKSRHQTEASTLISKEVSKASKALGLDLIVDDPRETTVQPLAWYAAQAYTAKFVVVHLINPEREGAHLHNAKYSFVSGLVHGLDKPLMMLAQGDSLAPLDYRDTLKNYQTGSEAERHLHAWFVPLLESLRNESLPKQLYLAQVKLAQELGQLKIGEPIAENESGQLISEYFVETNIYREALEGKVAIFVGRKGAGKSANFLKLTSALQADKRNLVCVIKPLAYEMQGIIELLHRYQSMNLKSYAVESIWKFLIYSEIAMFTKGLIESRADQTPLDSEKDLLALLDQNSEMLQQEFAVRLERCISNLLDATSGVSFDDKLEKGRTAISESLHTGLLRRLRETLAQALKGRHRIAILIDNLDKAWDKQSDITQMSEFLLGLLSASARLDADFRHVGKDRITLHTSLALFLRDDIFQRVQSLAREPDKIVYTRLTWNDDEVLARIIDQRFTSSLNKSPEEVWAAYFQSVRGLPAKEYILSRILKRPRDLIYFVKACIGTAVNRRHAMVTERDVLDAEKQYSQFAVDSILVENGISISALDSILYEFLGVESELDRAKVESVLKSGGVSTDRIGYVIDHLCSLTFLGIEVKDDEFRFANEQVELQRNLILSKHLVEARGYPSRYRIHPAFRAFLEVSE